MTDVRSNWSLPSATQDGEREVHRQEPDECDLQAQLLENELWFRRLYAQVISIEEQGTAFPSLSDRIDGREKYQRSVKAFKQETLRLALRDRELLAALPHADRSFLEGLQDRLEALQTVLERTRNSIEEKGAKPPGPGLTEPAPRAPFGKGRRGHGVGTFFCGLRQPAFTAGAAAGRFQARPGSPAADAQAGARHARAWLLPAGGARRSRHHD